MSKRLILLGVFVALLAAPAASYADKPAPPRHPTDSEGCLVVDSGQGTVTVVARGGIFGRFDQGRVTIDSLSPSDASKAKVFGAEDVQQLTPTKFRYVGFDVRFRFTGGGPYRVTVQAIGIDLSAIGNGFAVLNGGLFAEPGSFSVDGGTFCAKGFKPLPDVATKVLLGSG